VGVAEVGEAGEGTGGFVDEGERFLIVEPFKFGGGVALGMMGT